MSIHFLGILFASYVATHAECHADIRSTKQPLLPAEGIDDNDRHSISTHIFGESIPLLSSRTDLVRQSRAQQDYVHEVTFIIRQNNMDELTRVLHDVSNPSSPNYGQHWTRDAVIALTVNPEGQGAVTSYLLSKGAFVVSISSTREYIRAKAAISVWEAMFNTEFYAFHLTQYNGKVNKVMRAEKYWIPRVLESHIDCVLNMIDVPLRLFGYLPKVASSPISDGYASSTSVDITPQVIQSYYNMSSTVTGSTLSTQATFASIEQYLSPTDLNTFQKDFGLIVQPISKDIGNFTSNTLCIRDPNSCVESNLDIQYIMGISQISPTTYWYSDLSFGDWLYTVANTKNPPLVISISYGQDEAYTSSSELDLFNNQAIKLGAMGVSIFVSSGDDGANSRDVRTSGKSSCGYSPSFPATSPYVTAVGATSVRFIHSNVISSIFIF